MFTSLTLAKQNIDCDWGVSCLVKYYVNNTKFTENVVYKFY
jgi:hypothetical protein